MSMKYFSTFTGIGGFELGIQYAYEQKYGMGSKEAWNKGVGNSINARDSGNTKGSRVKPQRSICVGYSETDKYAIEIYDKKFNHKNYGDITTINAKEVPDHDLFVGGFPCQAFSIAGKRKGFNDTRGTLFFDIARIVREKQPRLLLLENVKGLLSHDQGRTFYTIITTLDEMGYDCQWQVLNSKNHGVPQNRERVFIIGHLRGTPRPQVFPFGEGAEETTRQVINPLKGKTDYGWHLEQNIYDPEGITRTVKAGGGSGNMPKVIVDKCNCNEGGACEACCVGCGEHKEQCTCGDANQISKTVRAGGRMSPHGSKQNWDSYEVEGRIRRLTPTECERLQGFPDRWTEGVSDTQRYKTLGNAVTVNVIRDIVGKLLD